MKYREEICNFPTFPPTFHVIRGSEIDLITIKRETEREIWNVENSNRWIECWYWQRVTDSVRDDRESVKRSSREGWLPFVTLILGWRCASNGQDTRRVGDPVARAFHAIYPSFRYRSMGIRAASTPNPHVYSGRSDGTERAGWKIYPVKSRVGIEG